MEPQFYDLLTASAQEVFETMSFQEAIPDPPVGETVAIEGMSLSATVALGGEISGYLAIHASTEFITSCSRAMAGDDGSEVDPGLLRDTAGELANMIAGTLKRSMSTQLDLFEISLPVILHSDGHRLFFSGAKQAFPRLLVPFRTEEASPTFYVELLFHKR